MRLFQLYIWHYNKRGEPSSPTIILKTRRSLRAVHFHPQAAPFLLTAEVNYKRVVVVLFTRAIHADYIIELICRSMILTLQIPQ